MWLDWRRMFAVTPDRGTTFDVAVISRRINPVIGDYVR